MYAINLKKKIFLKKVKVFTKKIMIKLDKIKRL